MALSNYDAGKLPRPHRNVPDLVYLIMELVDGGDLNSYVASKGVVPVKLACEWIRQAAMGLQEAHDHHLVHRDVKLGNLLLTSKGQVKLVDFGLVRQFSTQRTDPNSLLGTVDFMAPEQASDPSSAGTASDVYGLGATLFFLLTGEPPFPRARSLAQGLRRLQTEKPRLLRSLRPGVPPDLELLVERMLNPIPTLRPSMPLTVSHALQPFLDVG